MRHAITLATAGLLLASAGHSDGLPPVPADYPSHSRVGSCFQGSLNERLQNYNEARLQVADIMRHLADDPLTSSGARQKLLGYAEMLDEMRRRLPPPDPDSTAFQNFDFRLGLALTAMTVFLNSEDEQLTRRFQTDRDDPHSELGRYLVRLEHSRQQYSDVLAASKRGDCSS